MAVDPRLRCDASFELSSHHQLSLSPGRTNQLNEQTNDRKTTNKVCLTNDDEGEEKKKRQKDDHAGGTGWTDKAWTIKDGHFWTNVKGRWELDPDAALNVQGRALNERKRTVKTVGAGSRTRQSID